LTGGAKTLAVLYLAAVIVLTIRALGYSDGDWLMVLIVATLPWSLVALPFLWSLMHGASLWFFCWCSSAAGRPTPSCGGDMHHAFYR
jgi:hypothetical protein